MGDKFAYLKFLKRNPGRVITVSADTGHIYKGLLLKALAVGSDTGAEGFFSINDPYTEHYHTLNCSASSGSAVTHSSNVLKLGVTVTWTAPSVSGNFVFVATAVQEYYTFWANFKSADTVEVIGAPA